MKRKTDKRAKIKSQFLIAIMFDNNFKEILF